MKNDFPLCFLMFSVSEKCIVLRFCLILQVSVCYYTGIIKVWKACEKASNIPLIPVRSLALRKDCNDILKQKN